MVVMVHTVVVVHMVVELVTRTHDQYLGVWQKV